MLKRCCTDEQVEYGRGKVLRVWLGRHELTQNSPSTNTAAERPLSRLTSQFEFHRREATVQRGAPYLGNGSPGVGSVDEKAKVTGRTIRRERACSPASR